MNEALALGMGLEPIRRCNQCGSERITVYVSREIVRDHGHPQAHLVAMRKASGRQWLQIHCQDCPNTMQALRHADGSFELGVEAPWETNIEGPL